MSIIFAILMFSLLIFIFGLTLMLENEKNRVDNVSNRLVKAEHDVKGIKELKANFDSKKNDFNEINQLISSRNEWGKLIQVIQSKMPENMWLVTLEYDGDRKLKSSGGSEEYIASGEEGVTSVRVADPNKRQTIDQVANNQDINRVRIVGYTRDTSSTRFYQDMRKYAEKEDSLFSQIRSSEHNQNSPRCNLHYFEYILTLRNPMKK